MGGYPAGGSVVTGINFTFIFNLIYHTVSACFVTVYGSFKFVCLFVVVFYSYPFQLIMIIMLSYPCFKYCNEPLFAFLAPDKG